MADQLTPHLAYPLTPPLPAEPRALIDLHRGHGGALSLYCDADALAGRRVMEMGCGCGNLGKLLGRYVTSYLGTDFSTLALAVARLVSPANCTYVHVADRAGLRPFFGTVETVVGRYFWIHQNHELAACNLDYWRASGAGGRYYADFYGPTRVEQGSSSRPSSRCRGAGRRHLRYEHPPSSASSKVDRTLLREEWCRDAASLVGSSGGRRVNGTGRLLLAAPACCSLGIWSTAARWRRSAPR